MKPAIRCAFTLAGNIEATSFDRDHPRDPWRLVIDPRTGHVLDANVAIGTDMFRWLVTEARQHVAA